MKHAADAWLFRLPRFGTVFHHRGSFVNSSFTPVFSVGGSHFLTKNDVFHVGYLRKLA
jgi:hypothetical protein